jgi:bifunctional non-homologous end joining protein LigD
MTALMPELADVPAKGVFGGELVAFLEGQPHFPHVCDRILHGDTSVPLTYVIFDVLELEGESTVDKPYRERREILDRLHLGVGPWFVSETFDDGGGSLRRRLRAGTAGTRGGRREAPQPALPAG